MRSHKPYKSATGVRQMIDYLHGRLSNREKNRLEREMLADAFEADAFDGLSRLSGNELENDLKLLSDRIGKRHQKIRIGGIFLRVASVLMLLIVPAIIVWMIVRTGETKEFAVNKSENAIVDTLNLYQPIIAANTPPRNTIKFSPPVIVPDEEVADDEMEMKTQQEVVSSISAIGAVDYDKGTDNVEVLIAPVTDEAEAEKPITVPANALAGKLAGVAVSRHSEQAKKEEKSAMRLVKGTVVDDQDQPLPGVTVTIKGTSNGTVTDIDGHFTIQAPDSDHKAMLQARYIGFDDKLIAANTDSVGVVKLKSSEQALNEVAVVGYGAQKSEDIVVTSPEPVVGMRAYEKALSEAAVFPDGAKQQKEVVVLSVSINSAGSITDMKVIKSPGLPFELEAVRVVKNGLAWNPARKGARAVDGIKKIRVIFLPQKK